MANRFKILVIGNGFDLAHELLTSYFDFLYACCLVNGRRFNGKNYVNGKKEEYDKKRFSIEKAVVKQFNKYVEIIKNNRWINYFLDVVDRMEPTWIDLEREIYDVCRLISQVKKGENDILFKGEKYNKNDFKSLNKESEDYDLDLLKNDLKMFINILDIYLKIASSTNKNIFYDEIIEYDPNYVINFNYTDTYLKLYNDGVSIDYVHGKLSKKGNENTIVLGFNSTDQIETDLLFAEFLKYYQMVKNKIEVDIFDKLRNMVWIVNGQFEHASNYELMFFGHSMDKTDADILLPLIENAKKVTIVYHSENSMSEMIKHLMEMIGEREKFIEYCFKSNKKIVFNLQTRKNKNKKKHAQIKKLYYFLKVKIEYQKDYDNLIQFCKDDPLDIDAEKYSVLINKLVEYMKITNYNDLKIRETDYALIKKRMSEKKVSTHTGLSYDAEDILYEKKHNFRLLSEDE